MSLLAGQRRYDTPVSAPVPLDRTPQLEWQTLNYARQGSGRPEAAGDRPAAGGGRRAPGEDGGRISGDLPNRLPITKMCDARLDKLPDDSP